MHVMLTVMSGFLFLFLIFRFWIKCLFTPHSLAEFLATKLPSALSQTLPSPWDIVYS